MNRWRAVFLREVTTRVRTRAFVIATLLGPALVGLLVFMPMLLAGRETSAKRVVVLDAASGGFGARVEAALAAARRGSSPEAKLRYVVDRVGASGRLEAVRDSLVARTGLVDEGATGLDGILVATDEALTSGKISYLGENVGSPSDMAALEGVLQPVVLTERLDRAGVDPQLVMQAAGPIDLVTSKVTGGKLTGESGEASFLLAYIMSFILYMALVLYGVQIMGSVVEEKTSRIMEILVSSVTPFWLMLGKILGVAVVGLLQLAIWAGTAALLTNFRGPIAGRLGFAPESLAALPIPTFSSGLLTVFLIFFALGFVLYAAAYAAAGAMCSSHQETQQTQIPITMVIVLGFIMVFGLLDDANGTLARVLSLVPFTAPFVVPVRYSISPTGLPGVLLAVGTTILGIFGVVWVASRIYRVGILMYGKKPTARELLHWVRVR